jgi:aspartate-semialdehyde dehydrogenase
MDGCHKKSGIPDFNPLSFRIHGYPPEDDLPHGVGASDLPTDPEGSLILLENLDGSQTRLYRMAGSVPGMSVTIGRVRPGMDPRSPQFVVPGHNTIRDASGGEITLAERRIK